MGNVIRSIACLAVLICSVLTPGCTAGTTAPMPVPVVSTGNYVYDAEFKTLSVQVYGATDKLNPTAMYIYTVTSTKRSTNEYVLSGTVADGTNAEPFRANRGMARAVLNLKDIGPGTYTLIDSSTEKVVGTIDTSAPPPPFTDPV
jgi:hypothetical protein